MKKHILLTRPQKEAEELRPLIEERGYEVTIYPLLNIVYKPVQIEDPYQYAGLIFTSRHALQAFITDNDKRDMPVYVIGPQTENYARQHGFSNIRTADSHLETLEKIVLQATQHKPFLYLHGQHITRPLHQDILHHAHIVYEAQKIETMDEEISHQILNGSFSHIGFFSKRTAKHFTTLIKRTNKNTTSLKDTKALCLSNSMIEFLDIFPWHSIETAPAADREGFLSLLT